jgi:hypothetical protein
MKMTLLGNIRKLQFISISFTAPRFSWFSQNQMQCFSLIVSYRRTAQTLNSQWKPFFWNKFEPCFILYTSWKDYPKSVLWLLYNAEGRKLQELKHPRWLSVNGCGRYNPK